MDIGDGEISDIPTRPMRVKILYTFDENKTNCLARFQDVRQIPTVAIDESSSVGVIELQQCLQAVIGASPELISRFSDGDFTVYAYDYSEYDTPLVGQGMLSAVLTSTPSNQQNKSMITGRVCKNVLGLFSNGVKETLEVKLRLVPVPKPAQNEFNPLRTLSPAMSGGFDPNAFHASMQNKQVNDYFDLNAMVGGGDGGATGLVDEIFGLASGSSGSAGGQQVAGGVGIAETPSDGHQGFNPAFAAHPHSAPGSRAASPMMVPESSTRNDMLRHQSFSGNPSTFISDQSRPVSRASVRSEVDSTALPHEAKLPQQQQQQQPPTEVYYNEDGQPRKRARIQQADWHGRSSFGSKSADLRVTAATAASMHMHRPIPKRSNAPGSNLEPPPRVPTPVPQRTTMLPQQQQAAGRRSMLRQASVADSDFMSDIENFSDAIVSSPDEDSPGNSVTAEGTPQDFPSSPPVFPGMGLPEPSSPGLPTLPPPRLADSGYMSERGLTSSNLMENLDDDPNRSPDAREYEMAARYQAREKSSHPVVKIEPGAHELPLSARTPQFQDMNIQMVIPGDPSQLPQKMLLNLPPERREGSQGPQSSANKRPAGADRPLPKSQRTAATPSEAAGSRRGSLALPPSAPPISSDLPDDAIKERPAPRKRQSLHRSRTTSNESEAGSPAPSDNEGGRPKGPGRSGSGAQRRKLIEERLKASIANGAAPQYCSHCGAIETPTWRRLYVKEVEGKPSRLDEAEGEGETIGVEVTSTDESTGEANKFLIRKSMKKTKDMQPGPGFKDVVVCNPCGLWFMKYRSMRPSDKWGRQSVLRRSKKQRTSEESGFFTDGIEPPSDMLYTDQVMPDDAAEDADGEGDNENDLPLNPAQMRGHRPRANSLQVSQPDHPTAMGQWNASQLNAALAREVQSSPVRFQGSQATPIEIELTPQPTRRLLFPSPRKEGEVKSLDDNAQVSLKAMPHSDPLLHDKTGIDFDFGNTDPNVFAFFDDKENVVPDDGGTYDAFAGLFDASPNAFIFKTPSKKTPAKVPSTPSRVPPSPSPSSSRYFLRSTPSRAERSTSWEAWLSSEFDGVEGL